MHRGVDPTDLVGDGAVIGVDPEPRLPARDPEGFEGPEARGWSRGLRVLLDLVTRDEFVAVEETAREFRRTPHGGEFAGHVVGLDLQDRKSTRLNSSHVKISYAV